MKKVIILLFIFLLFLTTLVFASSDDNPIVYITKNSAKYHLAGCDYLNGQPHAVRLSYAKSQGYGACKHCKPYVKESNNDFDFEAILLGILCTAFCYLAAPIYLKFIKKKLYTNKEARKITIINCLIVYFIFSFVNSVILDNGELANINATIIWGCVAYAVLQPGNKEKNLSQ